MRRGKHSLPSRYASYIYEEKRSNKSLRNIKLIIPTLFFKKSLLIKEKIKFFGIVTALSTEMLIKVEAKTADVMRVFSASFLAYAKFGVGYFLL